MTQLDIYRVSWLMTISCKIHYPSSKLFKESFESTVEVAQSGFLVGIKKYKIPSHNRSEKKKLFRSRTMCFLLRLFQWWKLCRAYINNLIWNLHMSTRENACRKKNLRELKFFFVTSLITWKCTSSLFRLKKGSHSHHWRCSVPKMLNKHKMKQRV